VTDRALTIVAIVMSTVALVEVWRILGALAP
jgi:hypothetical protein